MAVLGKPLPRMLRLIAEAIDGRERVLEVAAGTGLVTEIVARKTRQVVATDYGAEMVARLQDRIRTAGVNNVAVEQTYIYQLRFEAHSFDAVIAANVLHLVPHLPGALRGTGASVPVSEWILKEGDIPALGRHLEGEVREGFETTSRSGARRPGGRRVGVRR